MGFREWVLRFWDLEGSSGIFRILVGELGVFNIFVIEKRGF